MKILMLIDSLEVGGAETHLCSLCAQLKKEGHSIIVASSGGKMLYILQNVGVKHHFLPSFNIKFPQRAQNKLKCTSIADAIKKLLQIVILEKPDIVHAHTRKTSFIANIVCKNQKIPLISTAHAMFSMKGYKGILSLWGDGTIAVSEDIAKHISKHSLIKPKRLRVIRNGVFI